MKVASDVLVLIKEHDVKFVDFRFTDSYGVWHHMTFNSAAISEDILQEGTLFDGSSIHGWKAINESDMVLMPDIATATFDPFFANSTLSIICDVLDPATNEPYSRDPRGIAKRAEIYLQSTGIADSVMVGAEPEFFLFSDVTYENGPYHMSFRIDDPELAVNSNTRYNSGNNGYHIERKSGYAPLSPLDASQDLRGEMLTALSSMGVVTEKHHHETASAQHELGIKYTNLSALGDQIQLYKYCVRSVAQSYGKTATFMPKPVFGDNGSGMHVHQSLWKNGKPLFAGDKYADLSQECLYFIGGVIKHAKALNAFANPSTNSYKRLVPGFEAPVLLAYSARNRSAAVRIPWATSPKAKRIEVRFPDPLANPYLCFSAILMAGIDGILNRIDPGSAMDKNLYDLPPRELKKVPTVSTSLREALSSLDKDRGFLRMGGVFTDDAINAFIELKMKEVQTIEQSPHPAEYGLYFAK